MDSMGDCRHCETADAAGIQFDHSRFVTLECTDSTILQKHISIYDVYEVW